MYLSAELSGMRLRIPNSSISCQSELFGLHLDFQEILTNSRVSSSQNLPKSFSLQQLLHIGSKKMDPP